MQLALDISPSLHRTLSDRAERYGMSLESWVGDLLAKQAAAAVAPDPPAAGGNSIADWLATTDRMTAEDAQAIDDAVALMDAADLAAQSSDK